MNSSRHFSDDPQSQFEETRLAQYAAIVESSEDAIISKTLDGIITSWNRSAERIFGYSAQESIGQSMLMLFPEDRKAEEAEILARIRRGEKVEHFETVRVTKSGKQINVSVTLSPIRNAQGKIIGASKIARDITHRKHLEQVHLASEARYRTLFECSPYGIVIADSNSFYLDANSSICRMLGYTRDELIGLNASDIVVPSEFKHIAPALEKIKATADYSREWQFKRKDGSVFSAEVTATTMPGGNLLGMIRDVTERKEMEQSLRDSEQRFRTMANSIPQLAWIARDDGYIFWYNERWYEYTGTAPEQMEGWGWQSVHDAKVLPEVMENWQAAIDTGMPFEMEFPLRGADGQFRSFLTRVQPLKDSKGQVMQWFGTNTDISTLKEAERKIRQINVELEHRVARRTVELEEANKELEAFSYSVSHDLRAPLRAVNGFAGIVLEDFSSLLPQEGRRHLERIREGGRRMGQLIDDLLTFSRLSRQHATRQTVETTDLVQDVLDELKPLHEGRKIEIRFGKLPVCEGDRSLLKQVWVNLISNAMKYTRGREPAIIEIGCGRENDQNVFFVRDNGAGFDMQYVNKLFGVFQRLHRADEFEGTGVGLAIVQRIVHRHSGRIWAQAEINRGATFSFTLEEKSSL